VDVTVLSKKTSGGLFIQFEIRDPSETEIDGLMLEPPGDLVRRLQQMEEEMRRSGEICESPDTGFQERIEPMSDTSYICSAIFEVRDEAAGEAFIDRLARVLEAARFDVDYF